MFEGNRDSALVEGTESVKPRYLNGEIVADHRDCRHEPIITFVLWTRSAPALAKPASVTTRRLLIAFAQFRAARVVRRGSLGPFPGVPRARARLPYVAGVAAARPAMLPVRSATR